MDDACSPASVQEIQTLEQAPQTSGWTESHHPHPLVQQALIEHYLYDKLSSKPEEHRVKQNRHNFCTYGVFGLVGETAGTVAVLAA